MVRVILVWTFWASMGGLAYAYAGYPLLLLLLSRRGRGSGAGVSPAPVSWPSVAVLIPAHNERANIDAKVANTNALIYPGRLRVSFISDGSTDGTNERVRAVADGRTTLIELTGRGGKAAALNTALADTTEDIVVFSDASIMLAPDAIERIVAPFNDPVIGCVSGEDRIAGAGGEGLYGRYELYVRRQESALGSIVGASGSFYAQRRELCEPFGTLAIDGNAPSAPVATANPLAQRLIGAGDLAVEAKQAWTPVAEFAAAGLDAVNFGPGDPVYAHRRDERVSVAALVRCHRTLERFVCA